VEALEGTSGPFALNSLRSKWATDAETASEIVERLVELGVLGRTAGETVHYTLPPLTRAGL
jgi:hypothetical protein